MDAGGYTVAQKRTSLHVQQWVAYLNGENERQPYASHDTTRCALSAVLALVGLGLGPAVRWSWVCAVRRRCAKGPDNHELRFGNPPSSNGVAWRAFVVQRHKTRNKCYTASVAAAAVVHG